MTTYKIKAICYKGPRIFKVKADSLQEAAEKAREKLDQEAYSRFHVKEVPQC